MHHITPFETKNSYIFWEGAQPIHRPHPLAAYGTYIFSRLWHSTCDSPMFQWCWRPWLRWASSLCSQRDAACICWWAPVSCCLEYGAWTYRLISPAAQRSASNPPSTVATVDRTDGRTPDRYIDSVPHTTRATSKRLHKENARTKSDWDICIQIFYICYPMTQNSNKKTDNHDDHF